MQFSSFLVWKPFFLATMIATIASQNVLAQTTESTIAPETMLPGKPILTNPTIVPNFVTLPSANTIVKLRPVTIGFRDAGNTVGDGDAITVTLNGAIIANDILLTAVDQNFPVNLALGINTLVITATSEGSVPNSTPLVTIDPNGILSGQSQYGYTLTVLQSASITLAFALVDSASLSTTPDVAAHDISAQNAGFSRLCTKDQAGANARSRASIAASGVQVVAGFQRDEYPPKICLENAGTASVLNVPRGQNSAAGGILGAGSGTFSNGQTFELRVRP
jgi:hypothetical protein